MVNSSKHKVLFLMILVLLHINNILLNVSLTESGADIQILSYTGFLTNYGGTLAYRVVGEVKNVGSRAYNNTFVNIVLYDQGNNIITNATVKTELSVIGPNRISPFSFIEFNATKAVNVARCEVMISSYNETQPKEGNLELYSYYDRYKISGEISNKGTSETKFVTVFATFYDANKRVVDVYSSQTIAILESYHSENFDIYFPSPDMFKRARYYSLTAESRDYTIDNETGLIELSPPPQPYAKFEVTPASNIQVGQAITFNASESYDLDGNITSYEWDFGDGNITTTSNPIITHSYLENGTYTIKLVVIDNDGYNSTAVGQIVVQPSTGGDGTYALFVLFGVCIAFSAAVLFIAIGLAKWKHKPRRRRIKRTNVKYTPHKIRLKYNLMTWL